MADDEVPGWDAIDAACAAVYGDQEPLHWGTIIRWSLGGPDPLDGISAYRAEDPPHWHIVTYGMSELYEKVSDRAEVSGWGFELTMRLERDPADERPPNWALNFLQNLGRYVFQTGYPFAPGQTMSLNGPIALGQATAIRAITFREDPALGEIDTAHGRLLFLQVLGITEDEREAAIRWNGVGVMDLLGKADPHGIVALGRPSIVDDPAVREAIEHGVATEGSACGMLYVSDLSIEEGPPAVLRLGALQVPTIAAVLPARIRFGEGLMLASAELEVGLVPGETPSVEVRGSSVAVALDVAVAVALADSLVPKRGRYAIPSFPGLIVEVVPTEIRDGAGELIEVVG